MENGLARVKDALEEPAPGWKLLDNDQLECWFWHGDGPMPTKFLLRTSAVCSARAQELLRFERETKERAEACEAKMAEARARAEEAGSNVVKGLLAFKDQLFASDELTTAKIAAQEYATHAERAKGCEVDLGGDHGTYVLGKGGLLIAAKGPDAKPVQGGTFRAWLTKKG